MQEVGLMSTLKLCRMAGLLAAFMSLSCAGGTQGRVGAQTENLSVYQQARSLTDRGRYHEALLLYPAMLAELSREGFDEEGVPGFELDRIVTAAARSGDFREWGRIFSDPEIPMPTKESLLLFIDTFSHRE